VFSFLPHLLRVSVASRRTGYAVLGALILVYGLVALRGPQGIPALLDKRREIRQLEEQNAATAAEIERRKDRIQRLQQNTTEQEMEIRKQLKLLRPGETTFILPDAPKTTNPDAPPGSPAAQQP
jgi:cell division protein FtsB